MNEMERNGNDDDDDDDEKRNVMRQCFIYLERPRCTPSRGFLVSAKSGVGSGGMIFYREQAAEIERAPFKIHNKASNTCAQRDQPRPALSIYV